MMQVKPVLVTKEDGTTETIYIQDTPTKTSQFREHLTLVATIVTIVALSLTAGISYYNLKKLNNGQ